MLYAGPGAVLTGLAALHRHEIKVPALTRVDVLVPVSRKRESRRYVVLHRTRRLPETIFCDSPVMFAPVARAVADAVPEITKLSDARALVASAVQRRKCTVPELAAELRHGPVPGAKRLRAILAEVADGARSIAEGDFRRLILTSGLPRPLFNPELYLDGQFLARPDAWWPEAGVAVEIDSKEWHLLPEDWERTMLRHDRMAAAGVRALHFTPQQVHNQGADVLRLIAPALAVGRPVPGITWTPAAVAQR